MKDVANGGVSCEVFITFGPGGCDTDAKIEPRRASPRDEVAAVGPDTDA